MKNFFLVISLSLAFPFFILAQIGKIADVGIFAPGTYGTDMTVEFEVAFKFSSSTAEDASSSKMIFYVPANTFPSDVELTVVDNQLSVGQFIFQPYNPPTSNALAFNSNDYYFFAYDQIPFVISAISATSEWQHMFSIKNNTPALRRAPSDWTVADRSSDIFPLGGEAFTSAINVDGENIVVDNSSQSVVPVDLVSFKAKKQDKYSSLTWITASEINNDFFDVERSADSRNFVSIGRVQGNGTTNDLQNYSFLDRNPLSGKNYYRLKQVDYNGAFEYSNTELVDFSEGREGIEVFPNPTADYITMTLDRTYEKIKVVNNLGQLVETISSTQLDNNEIKVNVSDYAPGVYFIEAKVGTEILNKQFVKVN